MKPILTIALLLFTLLSGAQTIDSTSICEKLTYNADKYQTGRSSWNTPRSEPAYFYLNYMKGIRGLDTGVISITLTCPAPEPIFKSGINIRLSNGQILKFPGAKIETDVTDDGFRWRASAPLRGTDLEAFLTTTISSYQIYAGDNQLPPEKGELLRQYLVCLTRKKFTD